MKNSQPLISVIMSAFNSEKSIGNALESIINQEYKNFEFLILDDFSTDNTYEIIQEYSKTDNRVRVYKNEKNIGLTKSLNILIKNSKGDYIARQDADDVSLKNRLDIQIERIIKKQLDFVISRATIKDTNKTIPGLSYYIPIKLAMKYKNPFIHGTLLINTNVIKSLGLYDENFFYSQDYKLFSDLMKSDYKYEFMKEKLYILNMENNISQLNKVEQEYYANCVRKNKTPKK
ncbi:glycosyltransferase [Acidimicrobiaceae bacterium]|nr:glycosyltransferase [Acidimicrobiaceae bacterium]